MAHHIGEVPPNALHLPPVVFGFLPLSSRQPKPTKRKEESAAAYKDRCSEGVAVYRKSCKELDDAAMVHYRAIFLGKFPSYILEMLDTEIEQALNCVRGDGESTKAFNGRRFKLFDQRAERLLEEATGGRGSCCRDLYTKLKARPFGTVGEKDFLYNSIGRLRAILNKKLRVHAEEQLLRAKEVLDNSAAAAAANPVALPGAVPPPPAEATFDFGPVFMLAESEAYLDALKVLKVQVGGLDVTELQTAKGDALQVIEGLDSGPVWI